MQRERRKNNDILFHFRKDGLPMTKLSQLKIDPEFQNQINPPSFEETHQLEITIILMLSFPLVTASNPNEAHNSVSGQLAF